MTERIKMTVEMEVTVPQALTLQAMFEHWNRLSNWGSSRVIAFYVDGDGNFHPHCKIKYSKPIPELTEEIKALAVIQEQKNGDRVYDFDPVAWHLHKGER